MIIWIIAIIFQRGIAFAGRKCLNRLTIPVIVNLDVMMAMRKMSLSELAGKMDITLFNLSILKTGKAKAIRFSTLEKLYEILECQPADILEFKK